MERVGGQSPTDRLAGIEWRVTARVNPSRPAFLELGMTKYQARTLYESLSALVEAGEI